MNTAQKTPTKFVLVCWLSDETVGVIPLSATKGAAHIDDEEEQDVVQGCTPKDPGVKVIECICNYIRGR